MTQSDSFSCPHCGTTYKYGKIEPGKKVRCKQCETPFVVPEPELSEAPAAPAPRERSASRSGTRSGGARGGAGRSGGREPKARGRASRADAAPKKSNTGILVGGGLGVVAIVLVLVFSGVFGGDPEPSPQPEPEKPKELTPSEKYAAALEAAGEAGSPATAILQYRKAIDLLESSSIESPRFSVEELHKKIIDKDPDDAKSRAALGYVRYTGGFEVYQNQWVEASKRPEIEKEYAAWKEEQAKQKEEEKWTRDDFAKKANKLRAYFTKYAAKVPDFDFKFFFDTPDIPRPFLFIVQDSQSPSPEQSVLITAPGIVALRKAFKAGYPEGTIPTWSDTDAVVPIMMFKDAAGYEHYIKHAKEHAGPSSKLAAAFYRNVPYDDAPVGTFRGIMFCWPGASDKDFYSSLFHEATHQIMHNASADGTYGRSPWLQEGIAEWWSAYEGNRHSGYKFGLFQDGRFGSVQQAAKLYYRGEKPGQNYFTPKRLINISNAEFLVWRTRDLRKMLLVYAQGWAFLYFCYYYEDDLYEGDDPAKKHPYREAFFKFIHDELRHELTPERSARYLGIEKEEDWDKLSEEFFFFCNRTMRSMR